MSAKSNPNKVAFRYKSLAYYYVMDKLAHYNDPKVSWKEVCADLERLIKPFECHKLGPVRIPVTVAQELVRMGVEHRNRMVPSDKQITKNLKLGTPRYKTTTAVLNAKTEKASPTFNETDFVKFKDELKKEMVSEFKDVLASLMSNTAQNNGNQI